MQIQFLNQTQAYKQKTQFYTMLGNAKIYRTIDIYETKTYFYICIIAVAMKILIVEYLNIMGLQILNEV